MPYSCERDTLNNIQMLRQFGKGVFHLARFHSPSSVQKHPEHRRRDARPPHLVGDNGAVATIPLGLNAEELVALQRSATILQSAIGSLPS